MQDSTESTLQLLNTWYLEVQQQQALTKSDLLCKLSLLELCGWIEIRFDALARKVGVRTACDAIWVEKNVIEKTYGFKFDDHFRSMICKLAGESAACKIDQEMEHRYPGSLSRLKSLLGSLWKDRGSFAHANLESNLIQTTFRAPSWCLANYRDIKTLMVELSLCIDTALDLHLAPGTGPTP